MPYPYCGSAVALATRHGKERALARPFRWALGLSLQPVESFDTDTLGTFCGERERPAGPLQTCRLKAQRGLECSGLRLGLASEGSFGPHPAVPFLPLAQEWLVFLDPERGLSIEESLVGSPTNFDHHLCRAGEDPSAWLARIGFPSHAVIVRPRHPAQPGEAVAKGLRDHAAVEAAIRRAAQASADGQVQLETDMRAHCNPTRMAAIRRLGVRLVRRLSSLCPRCGSPGWGVLERPRGLPCAWCHSPTDLVRAEIHGCVACGHQQERPRPDGLETADPGRCGFCNP
ncbi:MAG: DUF6671 family protein [Synechococcus sp.]|nr:DUF6671 family protein [Synechococcus sp.]